MNFARRLVLALAFTATSVALHTMAPCALAAADQSSTEKVLADAVKAMGGRAAVDAVKTIHTVSTMEMMGQKMGSETSCSRAGGRLQKMTTSMGEIISGSDGTTTWRKAPMGYMLLDEEEARPVRNQAAMHFMMMDPERAAKEEMKSMELVGTEKFDGRDCRKVHYVNKAGREGDFFFDVSSGLPAGSYQSDGGKGAKGPTTMVFSDWKTIEGVKFFHKITMETKDTSAAGPGGMKGSITFTSIEVNTLKDDAFALPEEVKALVKTKGDAKATPAEEIKFEDLSKQDQDEVKRTLDNMKKMPEAQRKQMVDQLEKYMGMMPEAQKKKLQYLVQEAKKVK